MKKTDLQKMSNKNKEELRKDMMEWQDKLWQLKVDLEAGKVKNVVLIRELHKNIARAKTLLNKDQN